MSEDGFAQWFTLGLDEDGHMHEISKVILKHSSKPELTGDLSVYVG